MKKNLFILAAAAVALASCSSDDLISENAAAKGGQPQEIALTALNQPSTRAAVQGTTFPTTNTMEVAAYISSATTPANYFAQTTFKYQYLAGATDATNNPNTWGGDPSRYWPLSPATLNFFAVSAETMNSTNGITINGDISTATVAYTSPTYDETSQKDIMYGFARGAVTKTGNNLSFNGGTTVATSKVAMTFNHAFALINFQIKAGDVPSKAIKIYKIEVDGAHYNGTLTLTNTANAQATTGDVTTSVDWAPAPADAVDGVVVPNIGNITTPVALTESFVPDNSDTEEPTDWASLMIIPKKQTTPLTEYGFTKFTIYYQLEGKDYTYEYAPAGWTSTTPNLQIVEAGKKYTYQIVMKLHEITIAPTVTAWVENGNGSGAAAQVNIP